MGSTKTNVTKGGADVHGIGRQRNEKPQKGRRVMTGAVPMHGWPLHFALAWVATAVLAALCGYVLWSQQQENERRSEITLRNSAVLLSAHVANGFEQTDALLRSVGYRYANAARLGTPQLARLTDEVRNDAAAHPLIKRIGIIDSDGINFFNTGFTSASDPRPDASDREYFRRAKAGERDLLFDGPLQPKLLREWALVVARRIDRDDGEFLGVVFAAIPVSSLGESLSRANTGPAGVIALRTADLALVVRVPELQSPNAAVGNRNAPQNLRDLLRDQPGRDHYVYRAVAPLDGIERLYTYQKVAQLPFGVIVGQATDSLGHAWQRTALLLALVIVPVSTFFFWVARRLGHEQLRLTQGIRDRTRDLARSETFFRGLTNTLPSLIGYWDDGLRNRFSNGTLEAWFGKASGELWGRPLGDFLTPEQLAAEEVFYRAALAGESQTFERHLKRPDGRLGDFLVTLTPDRVDGRVQGIFSQATEITEQKRAEAEIRRQAHELDDLYNQAPCGYHSLDAQGIVLRINDTELKWLGYARHEMLGKPYTAFLRPLRSRPSARTFPA